MAMNSDFNNKKSFWRLNKRERRVALVLLTGLVAGVLLPSRFVISTSDSLDHRIFFKVPINTARIENGDYLLFQLQVENHKSFIRQGLKDNNVMIKKVGCIPGEILTRDGGNTFHCNHTILGKAMERDNKGNELPVFKFIGPIPADSYFMMGTNPRSFDSRYFGLIHADAFISKALPLW